MLQVFCKNTQTSRKFPEGTSLLTMLNDFEFDRPYPIVSAKVNNVSQGLKFRVYQNKDIEFIDMAHPSGRRVYCRSLCFLLCAAAEDVFPGSKVYMEHPISNGFFCHLRKEDGSAVTPADVDALERRMKEIVEKNIPFHRYDVPMDRAVKAFSKAELVPVGRAADVMVASLNSYMKQQAATLGYKYADVTQTPIDDTVPFADPTFFDEIVKDCHPTLEGHKYIANQIIAQLPTRDQADPTPAQPTGLPFYDVSASDWFVNDVAYCYNNGLMNGMSATRFAPNETTTRAQFATVLYRLAGSPAVTASNPFSDCAGHWASKEIAWAYQKGIVTGVGNNRFAPDQQITREQMVTMLFRYSGAKEPSGSLSFTDAYRISSYARPAVIWAVQNNIVSGNPDGTFNPQGYATRAQLAKVLHMYVTK